jgi:hypothetical protein
MGMKSDLFPMQGPQALLRHLPGPLLIIWDGVSARRSKMTRSFIAEHGEDL